MRLAEQIKIILPALLLLFVLPQARSAEKIIFGHILNESTAHHQNLLWAASEIERRLDGRHQLQVFAEGQIGTTDAQVIEGFQTATADMAYLSFGHLLNVYPPLSIGAGPFVFRDFAHWKRFTESDLLRKQVADMEKKLDLKVFDGLAYYGARHVTTRQPLQGPENLKDLVIRVPNIPTMVLTFRALGAKPVQIQFKEVYQALEDGVVDAQENPLPAIKAMRFHEVTPAINLTAHILDAQFVVMNGEKWRRIPEEDQRILEQIFAQTAARVTSDVRQQELALADTLAEEGAVINPIDRTPLMEAIRPYHHSDYFPWGGALYERIQALE